MAKSFDFFFDLGSPTAYLAHQQLTDLAARTGLKPNYRPMLLGAVFKATGNDTPARVTAKFAYYKVDMARVAERGGFPFVMNSHFMINTLSVMRGVLVAAEMECLEPYVDALFDATWALDLDTGDEAVVREVLAKTEMDGEALLRRIQDESIKQALKDVTAEAVERGVFGAPTFFVDGEMFFGQDRLDWVESRLTE